MFFVHLERTAKLISVFVVQIRTCNVSYTFLLEAIIKYSLSHLQKFATRRNGKCLSPAYLGATKKHTWRCGTCNHEWDATWSAVNNQGSWCPKCAATNAGMKRWTSIEVLQKHAAVKGGKLVSTTYKTTKIKVQWECSEGHTWHAKWEKIKAGQWCPHCAKKKKNYKYNIEDMRNLAHSYGGECLSSKFQGVEHPLIFRCADGHEFRRQPALLTKTNPLQNVWCPKCKSFNHGEEMCRNVFELAFEAKFPNLYPGAWLTNVQGRKLQLDGYNANLKIAFEFQGLQHSTKIPFFQMDDEALEKRQEVDKLKQQLCERAGVKLVTIDEFDNRNTLTTSELLAHVTSACRRVGVFLPNLSLQTLEERNRYLFQKQLQNLQDTADQRGGKLLSNAYRGMSAVYEWRCFKCSNTWKSSASSVLLQKTWCPNCAGAIGPSIDELRSLANSRGGKLVSKELKGSKSPLVWHCNACNQTWSALYSNIKKGHWCPNCAIVNKRKKLIGELQGFLNQTGEVILNTAKFEAKKIEIRCKKGHFWTASSDRIKRLKLTCPECKKNQTKVALQNKLEFIVQEHGARLSSNYLNNRTKVKIICNQGHIWMTKPSSIFNGSWCPACVKEVKRKKAEFAFLDIVQKRNGKLLSNYVNAKTKAKLRCGEMGHIWHATPDSVQQGHWCPACNGGVKK